MSGPGKLIAALIVVILLLGSVPGVSLEASPEWVQLGLSEDVFALAIDPRSEATILATGSSGFWKTTDSGSSWSLVSPAPLYSALAIDPKNPSTIYASGHSGRGIGGIYKSNDGGKNWSVMRPGESPGTIVVDHANTSVVYAGLMIKSNYEILKSTDGGANWTPLLRPTGSQSPGMGNVTALALAPSNSSVIYAGLSGYHSGEVRRSDDGGANWRSIASGGLAPLMAPSAIAVDPKNPDIVYVGWTVMGAKKFFKSLDGGQSWQNLSSGLPQVGGAIASLLIDAVAGGSLIASIPGTFNGASDGAPGGIFISQDAGASWSRLGTGNADKAGVVLAAGSRLLYAGGRGGLASYRLSFRLDSRFQDYYDSHDGLRVLGSPLSPPLVLDGYTSQYFEKGRIEDHSNEVTDVNWKFMYGLLADDLQNAKALLPVGGETSSITYASLYGYSRPTERLAAPAGFQGGTLVYADGSAFIPYHHELQVEAGHKVPKLFWDYINRGDLFPGGWLHDVGLPMTEAVWARVDKGDVQGRNILIQAFQRSILTYDAANPADWQVERANVGTDYLKAFK